MQILIVDDSTITRMVLEKNLKSWGYEAVSVDNIDAAIEIVLNNDIHFVITDWVMPGGDGPTLCRKIRDLKQDFYVYIILITSLADSQSMVAGMDAGADDFIRKPIQMEELLARIRAGERVLDLQQALMEHNAKLQGLSNNLLAAQEVINKDLQLAEQMQRSLLPTCASSTKGVAIDGLFCPSGHVSGDIYNFFCLDEQHIGFYTIDVAGHGVAAAMMSFSLSQILTPHLNQSGPVKFSMPDAPYYEIGTPASKVVEKLNDTFQTDSINSLYFTMVYGLVNTKTHTLDLCQAGHPNPIYLPNSGSAQFIGDGGFPVGITLMAEYESIHLDYHQGDRFFFYSDGITECMNDKGEMFGEERLLGFFEETRKLPIKEMLSLLEQRITLWRGSKKFDDDISMLALVMTDDM